MVGSGRVGWGLTSAVFSSGPMGSAGRTRVHLDVRRAGGQHVDGQTAAQVQRRGVARQLVHHRQHPGRVRGRQQGGRGQGGSHFFQNLDFVIVEMLSKMKVDNLSRQRQTGNHLVSLQRGTPSGHCGHCSFRVFIEMANFFCNCKSCPPVAAAVLTPWSCRCCICSGF